MDFTNAAQAPATLASNSNYVMSDNGKNLTNVEVTVDITQDMVVAKNGPPQAGSGSVSGFSLQLNCFSPTKEADAWQQYVIGFDGSSLYGQINNWKDVIPFKWLINQVYSLTSTPSGKVPVNYKLRIVLQNDNKDNVSGVVFEVRNDDGKVIGSHTQTLTDIGGVSSADIAPIVACQVVIVGPGNSESVTFSSGAGTIIIQGSQAMVPNSGEPSDSEVTWGTAETSNSTYTRLSSTAGPYFAQSFGIDKTVTAVPTAPRKLLHPLPGRVRIPAAA